MNKAFTRETDGEDDDAGVLPPLPAGGKNYITPRGYAHLRAELLQLIDDERPKVVDIVHWAASNGDRSENGDYIYGKKRLREIDRRMRFLGKRLEIAEIVNPTAQSNQDQIFFGATVTYINERDEERTVTILGVDEADITRGEVSLHSPIARTLLRRRAGDTARLQTPQGIEEIEILAIRYPSPTTDP